MKDKMFEDYIELMNKIAKASNATFKLRYINVVYRQGSAKYTAGPGKADFSDVDVDKYNRIYGLDIDERYDKQIYVENYDYAPYHKLPNKLDMAATYE